MCVLRASRSTTTPCSQQIPWRAAARWTTPPSWTSVRRAAQTGSHLGNVRPARVEVHHHAVLQADSVASRGEVDDTPELDEREEGRADREPPRECASCAHR